MKLAFISILASSNNLSRSKVLKLSFLIKENGEVISKFDSYIKPVPALSKAEKENLAFDYSVLRSAPPFCDVAGNIIELLENAKTLFVDRFSQSIFKKAFREIGYPMGSATYILEKIFKSTFKLNNTFDLENALKACGLEVEVLNNLDRCWAMEKIFSQLEDLNEDSQSFTDLNRINEKAVYDIDLSHLPKYPGVYFFRDCSGEIIYVGKAKNISKRVKSHFGDKSSFERNLCSETASIDFEETGSETIALLLESHYINYLKPLHNTQQKSIIDPYIITSKLDSKGILRIQAFEKSYTDSENEFYFNRESVLIKILEIQRKFYLCKRFSGIERASGKCSDPVFCKGICQGLEDKEEYNQRVKSALDYLTEQRPSYILKLKGRTGYRIRQGNYRIIYDIFDDILQVDVIEMGHRKDIYE